jgi:hypothetical protein
MTRTPFQDDGLFSLDLTCKDHDTLERMHKQEGWSWDQLQHYEAGWQAAMEYYRENFIKEKSKRPRTHRRLDSKNRLSLKSLSPAKAYKVSVHVNGTITLTPENPW